MAPKGLDFRDDSNGKSYIEYLQTMNLPRCSCKDGGKNKNTSCHAPGCAYILKLNEEVSGAERKQRERER